MNKLAQVIITRDGEKAEVFIGYAVAETSTHYCIILDQTQTWGEWFAKSSPKIKANIMGRHN
jgi:hypothetical protein